MVTGNWRRIAGRRRFVWNGRRLPSAAPDASLMRRYEELLSRPNLWLADVDQVRWLAHQLDRRVEFVKVPVWPGK